MYNNYYNVCKGCFQMNQLFVSGGQSTGISA